MVTSLDNWTLTGSGNALTPEKVAKEIQRFRVKKPLLNIFNHQSVANEFCGRYITYRVRRELEAVNLT